MMRRGEKMEERADMKADGKPAERLTGSEQFHARTATVCRESGAEVAGRP